MVDPDEWVWKNVKHDRIGKTGVTRKDDLKTDDYLIGLGAAIRFTRAAWPAVAHPH